MDNITEYEKILAKPSPSDPMESKKMLSRPLKSELEPWLIA